MNSPVLNPCRAPEGFLLLGCCRHMRTTPFVLPASRIVALDPQVGKSTARRAILFPRRKQHEDLQ